MYKETTGEIMLFQKCVHYVWLLSFKAGLPVAVSV